MELCSYFDKLSVVFNLFRTVRELEVDPSVISGKNSSKCLRVIFPFVNVMFS